MFSQLEEFYFISTPLGISFCTGIMYSHGNNSHETQTNITVGNKGR